MADDLTIQGVNPQIKQKDNTALYTGIGAVAGAGAGLGVDRWMAKPKYASFNDLVAEKTDTFDTAIKNASDEKKGVWETAKKAKEEADQVKKNWDDEFKAFQEAHKEGEIVPDENYKNLEKELEAKKQAVTDKRTELEKAKLEELKKTNTGALTDEQKKVAETLNEKIEAIEKSKNAYITSREKAIENVNKVIAEPRTSYTYTEFGKTITAEGNKFEQLMQQKKTFENTIKSIEDHLKDKKFKKGSEVKFVDPKTKKVVSRVPQNTKEVKLAKEYFQKQYETALGKLFPGIDKGILNAVAEEASAVVENNLANNESIANKQAFLQKKAAAYNKALSDIPSDTDVLSEVKKNAAKGSHAEGLVNKYNTVQAEIKTLEADIAKLDPKADAAKINDLKNKLATKKENAKKSLDSIRQTYYMMQEAPLTQKVGELETQKLYRDIKRANELVAKENGSKPSTTWLGRILGIENPTRLNASEAAELKKLEARLAEAEKNLGTKEYQKVVTAAEKATDVDKTITKLEGEIKTLEDSIKTRKEAQKKISQISKEVEVWAGKGATIDAAGNIIKADGKVFVPEAGTNLASKVGTPIGDARISRFDSTIAGIKSHIPVEGTVHSEEKLAQMAKDAITDDMLKTQIDAQKAAQTALDEAKAKLPKGAAKTEAELLEEFKKSKGGKSVDDLVKEVGEKHNDKIKELFEKRGMNGRTAAWIAGGAIALAGLGYLLAPKNKA